LEKLSLIATLVLPLLSFILLFESGRIKAIAGWLSSFLFFVGLLISVNQLFLSDAKVVFTWFKLANIDFCITLRADAVAKSMTVLVYLIALLVNIYSITYMQGEKHYHKYFAYLGLFTFSMLGIVLFDNLLLVYAFWELVGLSSYLLIGFWYQNPLATMASKKAFIVNRVGDIGFLVGILLLWANYKTLDISHLINIPLTGSHTELAIALCLFCGCIGKSAQFPLQIWLPDAMQGPTPASALIHAATMVAAGIYLMIRVLAICPPEALLLFGLIGAVTAFMAALTACFQNDIKKILAYSTISQLGYMVVGLSTSKGEVAYLHLFTHAFFKAGLFLCAGAIIHEIAHQQIKINNKSIDSQDIQLMGGLAKKMKWTYYAYILCYLSAVGIPLSAGFVSKDFIIGHLLDHTLNNQNPLLYITALLTIVTIAITAYYMTRQLIMVFWGTYRASTHTHFHEAPVLMIAPVLILGLGSLFFMFTSHPLDAHSSYLFTYLQIPEQQVQSHWLAIGFSLVFTCVGVLLAYLKFRNWQSTSTEQYSAFSKLMYSHFYINKLYMRVVMPLSLRIARTMHRFDQQIILRFLTRT
jgi:NADH-quinone oxidoreductase subunit L